MLSLRKHHSISHHHTIKDIQCLLHLAFSLGRISRIPTNPRVSQRVGICKSKSWQARFPNSQADSRIPKSSPRVSQHLSISAVGSKCLDGSTCFLISQRIYSLIRECEQSSIRASCQVTEFVRVILERMIIVLESVSNIGDYQNIRMTW